MGVLYSVIPVDENNKILNWLKDSGIELPEDLAMGRNPTPKEIRDVLDSMDGYTVSYHVSATNWQADIFETACLRYEGTIPFIDGPNTLINVLNYQGDEERTHQIYFEKGWPELIIHIMVLLSEVCGPLVCLPDTGDEPIVVTPSLDVREALNAW